MSGLICGWCGKSDFPLIAGLGVYICHNCVFECLEKCVDIDPTKLKSDDACSFCNRKQSTLKKKLVVGNGVQICYYCLNTCNDIIVEIRGEQRTEEKGEATESEPEHACDCVHVEQTTLEKEWQQLSSSAKNDQELLELGKSWLKKNKNDQAAGPALASVLEIRSNSTLTSMALSWLEQYPKDQNAPEIIAHLMKSAPSARVTKLAGMWLKSPKDLYPASKIVAATIGSSKYPSLFKRIEELLELNPQSEDWFWLLKLPLREWNRRLDKLLVRWLQLNIHNPELHVYMSLILAKSPDVLQAGFDWIRAGGKNTKDAAQYLPHLLHATAQHHKQMLPRVIRFTRKWLKENPHNEEAGHVFGALLTETRSKTDINNARRWYEENKTIKSAWFVLADLLTHTYYHSHKPDLFAVENAKILLRNEHFRHQKSRLVGALIGAWVDEESVAWAKETYERQGLLWVLARLLVRAPDSDSIKDAVRVYKKWNDAKIEHEILLGILRAEPTNSFVLRRARLWLKRNPKHSWAKSIDVAVQNAQAKPRHGKKKGM